MIFLHCLLRYLYPLAHIRRTPSARSLPPQYPITPKQNILLKMMEAGLAEKVVDEIQYNFEFPLSEKLSGPAIVFQNVGFAYSGEEKDKL